MILKAGHVNNLYRDITAIYQHHLKNPSSYSPTFIGLLRMSLRLIVDLAAEDNSQNRDNYVRSNFASAKKRLSQNFKTTLSESDVTDTNLVQLLNAGVTLPSFNGVHSI